MSLSDFENLEAPESTRVRSALQRLVRTGVLQYVKKDDADDYQLLSLHRQMVAEWLNYADIRLHIDADYRVMCIRPMDEDLGKWDIDKIRTRDEIAILAIMRVLLEEARSADKKAGFCRATILEIRNRYNARMGTPLAQNHLQKALSKFRRMQFITYEGDMKDVASSVLIMPVLLYLTPKDIDNMIECARKASQIDNGDESDD